MRKNIFEEVAAFLNSYDGGTVLIGVDDTGNVIGLENDYRAANSQKANRDGYQLFLQGLLRDNLLGVWTQFYKISFGTVRGKDVCRIDVLPADGPVFTKQTGDFHIRDGNGKRKLNAYETSVYQKQRWVVQ